MSHPSRMITMGMELFRITPLVAVVYCRPRYANMLCRPVPQNASHTIIFQLRWIAAQWVRISGHAKGSITATATIQRMKVSASGETCPTIARPITQLSDQMSDVRLRSRYGEAWNVEMRRGIEACEAWREACLYAGCYAAPRDDRDPRMS